MKKVTRTGIRERQSLALLLEPPPLRGFTAPGPNVALFAVGLWLAVGPMTWDLRGQAGDLAGYRRDVLIGAVLAACATVRLISSRTQTPTQPVIFVIGIWFAVAPLAETATGDRDHLAAAVNDVAVGLTVIASLIAVGAARRRRRRRFVDQSPGIAR